MTQIADHPQVAEVLEQDAVLERVLLGAAFLDERSPGWERRINLQLLHLTSGTYCILGQLYGSFAGAYRGFGIEILTGNAWSPALLQHSIAHGFADPTARLNVLLTNCWRDVIRTRRGEVV